MVDAVKFDVSWQPPDADPSDERKFAVMKWCEAAMNARRVYVHPGFGGGPAFVSRTPEETEFFATSHPRAGQSRYDWTDHPSGCRLGSYVDGANE